MEDNDESNLIQKVIDKQDILSYFSFASRAENMFLERIDSECNMTDTEFLEFLENHPEIFENLSMDTLCLVFAGTNTEASRLASEQIIKRFRTGEHIFGRNAEITDIFGEVYSAQYIVLSRLSKKISKEISEEIEQSIKSNLEKLKAVDPRAYALASRIHNYAIIDNFLSSYENGNITPEKLAYLEKIANENPNIIENMDFELLRDEIFYMGEDFITRIARYPNMSTKLIGLQNVSPELFEMVKSGIMDLERNGRKPEILELEQAALTYAFRNYQKATELSFEEIVSNGLEEQKVISVKTEDGYTLIDPNEGANDTLEAVHRKYDIREKYSRTLVERLDETSRAIQEAEDVQYIDVGGRKIKQINLHGKFNILAHSTDSGFKEDKQIIDGDFKKTWMHVQDVSVHLKACCFMNQDFLGHVPAGKNGILMVFSDLETGDVSLMGPKDINSHIRKYTSDAAHAVYMSAEDLPQNARRIYAEVPIEKRIPNYLLIFDDTPEEVLNNTYKAALDFDIPIIHIDKREIEKNQLDNLDSMIQEFKKTGDISILEKLVSTYETNIAGWLLNRDRTEEDDSFTAEVGNERFRDDFETRGQEIFTLIQNYISVIESGDISRTSELAAIYRIMKAEIDKYELSNEENDLITRTAPSIDYQNIIDRIISLNRGEIPVDTTPTVQKKVDIISISEDAVKSGYIGLLDLQELTESIEVQYSDRVNSLESQGEDR